MFYSSWSNCFFFSQWSRLFSWWSEYFSADQMFLSQWSIKILYRQNVQLCRRAGGLVIPPATGDSVSPGLYSILQGGIVKAKHSLCHRDIALIKLFQHTGFIQVRTLESEHCPRTAPTYKLYSILIQRKIWYMVLVSLTEVTSRYIEKLSSNYVLEFQFYNW